LAIQLAEKDRLDPAMRRMLALLDDVAKGNLKKVARLCGVDMEDAQDMLKEIHALDPKPGSKFLGAVTQHVQPDVFVQQLPDNSWHVELNYDVLPKVVVNKRYYARVKKGVARSDDKSKMQVSQAFNHASWLAKAMDQRSQTILKVASEIVAQQEEFLSKGVKYLKPLVLSDIADAIQMHQSTISRVVTGKYMHTLMGLFEFKYFFSSSLSMESLEQSVVSSTFVKERIKALIDAEDAKSLSDEAIASNLRDQGFNVARRTVVKYREAMGIPSSVERRRRKALLVS